MSDTTTTKPFKATIEIPPHQIKDLLTNALEGGSNYWYNIQDEILAEGVNRSDFDHPHIDIPFVEGCALMLCDVEAEEDDDDDLWRLDLPAIHKGIQVMIEKYPEHWADFMAGNDDATTGDVFLQCCLFGELVYG